MLRIIREGSGKKFVNKVEQITFSGRYAAERGKTVYYITERCVFRLTRDGVELLEIAPGVDLEQDILAQMEFKPILADQPRLMDGRIFWDGAMGLCHGYHSGKGEL